MSPLRTHKFAEGALELLNQQVFRAKFFSFCDQGSLWPPPSVADSRHRKNLKLAFPSALSPERICGTHATIRASITCELSFHVHISPGALLLG